MKNCQFGDGDEVRVKKTGEMMQIESIEYLTKMDTDTMEQEPIRAKCVMIVADDACRDGTIAYKSQHAVFGFDELELVRKHFLNE